MTEIATCPFCGAVPFAGGDELDYVIRCDDCHVQPMALNNTREDTATIWNTRAPNAAAEGLAKALEEVLPYTEAERLAEAAAVRCGAMRDPIYKAIRAAQVALAAYRAGQPS